MMDYKLLMDTAVLAGETMLKSGAETYRVEDTMSHILRKSNEGHHEVLVMMTGLMATISEEGEAPVTVVRRVTSRGTNLKKVMRVNEISRRYCNDELTLKEAYEELLTVSQNGYREYTGRQNKIALGCAVVGFSIMFGGQTNDVLAAAAVGIVLALISAFGARLNAGDLIMDPLCSFGITSVAIMLKAFLPAEINMDIVIISAIMPLVPGVAITNAIRDTFQGNYLTGGSRMLEAFLKAALIALGVGIGMTVFGTTLIGRARL